MSLTPVGNSPQVRPINALLTSAITNLTTTDAHPTAGPGPDMKSILAAQADAAKSVALLTELRLPLRNRTDALKFATEGAAKLDKLVEFYSGTTPRPTYPEFRATTAFEARTLLTQARGALNRWHP